VEEKVIVEIKALEMIAGVTHQLQRRPDQLTSLIISGQRFPPAPRGSCHRLLALDLNLIELADFEELAS